MTPDHIRTPSAESLKGPQGNDGGERCPGGPPTLADSAALASLWEKAGIQVEVLVVVVLEGTVFCPLRFRVS